MVVSSFFLFWSLSCRVIWMLTFCGDVTSGFGSPGSVDIQVWFPGPTSKLSCADRGVVSPDFVPLLEPHPYMYGRQRRPIDPSNASCLSVILPYISNCLSLTGDPACILKCQLNIQRWTSVHRKLYSTHFSAY